MTTPAASLTIPDEARAAFAAQHKLPDPRHLIGHGGVDWEAVGRDLLAVAAPVVAAELRRLADELAAKRAVTGAARYTDGYFDGASMVVDAMTARADVLDGAS